MTLPNEDLTAEVPLDEPVTVVEAEDAGEAGGRDWED